MNKKIMLCCGAGMSSGFLASNARKYVKKNKLNLTIEARSHSEVAEYLSMIDDLLLGPHYKLELEHFRQLAAPYNVVVDVIPQDIYGSLNGEKLIEFSLNLIKGSN
ncbi:Lichenan-specific phosphotransferase enzyme IIB component [Streptococcus constellatus]|uniref:Lichenan-specific phosphotransferase enzyme IIB component n=1 Tax=Streptococcus constellatus TaxID=76860 RepID=A0A564TPK4_STRCV|nr:PTS sugar transporter subunit IIB [Streptococcus constellatus]VUX02268.1 Lichenan-specific phosphotransferase enzyme IIB component [Streptococcus gordonii]VUX09172.1 Lichenan-specific phosphotransferase enzyme IIB component [Streptococcus constellatus]